VLVDALAAIDDDGTQSEMLQHLDRAIAGWPEEPRPYQWAINTILYGRGDAVGARPYVEKALAVAALGEPERIDYLVVLGRLDEALARARRWAEENPGWLSFLNLAAVHRVRGEDREALEAARRSASFDSPPPHPRWTILRAFVDADALEEVEHELAKDPVSSGESPSTRAEWLALQGRWREALAFADAGRPPGDAPATARALYHARRAALLANGGRHADAVWREVEEQFRAGAGGGGLYHNAIHLALLGDLDRAKQLMGGWWFPDHRGSARLHRHIQAWKRGDREAALRGLAGMYGHDSDFYRGRILQELGREREAVEAFRHYRRTASTFYDFDAFFAYHPRSMYLEAVSLARLGERDEARRLVERLLRLWKRADPDGPFVREARAFHAALSGRSP
jgi:tetratricopeptide (TPR) repeat protein